MDSFWLGLFSASVQAELKNDSSSLKEVRNPRLMAFCERFAEVMDSRFSFTVGVSNRVAKLSEQLGRSVGLPEWRLKQLRVAALLHDVGQLGISERIMAKPGILSVEELEVLRNHPVHSQEIVAGITGLEEIAEWVAAHHERPDGRGYPEARPAEEIPVEARILAIADAYVAITSDRPHRRRLEAEEGTAHMRGVGGSQLDQDLLAVFLDRVVA
jgi:HD-GYP domain-containing protein (c-di-GMP phosphodiesterase class II)